jgi:hypothetical protein
MTIGGLLPCQRLCGISNCAYPMPRWNSIDATDPVNDAPCRLFELFLWVASLSEYILNASIRYLIAANDSRGFASSPTIGPVSSPGICFLSPEDHWRDSSSIPADIILARIELADSQCSPVRYLSPEQFFLLAGKLNSTSWLDPNPRAGCFPHWNPRIILPRAPAPIFF